MHTCTAKMAGSSSCWPCQWTNFWEPPPFVPSVSETVAPHVFPVADLACGYFWYSSFNMELAHTRPTRQSLRHVIPPDPSALAGLWDSTLFSPVTYHLASAGLPLSKPPSLFSSHGVFHKTFSHDEGMSRILKARNENTSDFASSPKNS